MKKLTWWQAEQLARSGRPVRRPGWPENPIKWIAYRDSLFWVDEEKNPLLDEGVTANEPGESRVVQETDFGYDEFVATDWTNDAPYVAKLVAGGAQLRTASSMPAPTYFTGLSANNAMGGAMLQLAHVLPRIPATISDSSHPRLGNPIEPPLIADLTNLGKGNAGFTGVVDEIQWDGAARWELSGEAVMSVGDEVVLYNEAGAAFAGRQWNAGVIAQFYSSARYRTNPKRPWRWLPWRVNSTMILSGLIEKTLQDLTVEGVTGFLYHGELTSGWGFILGFPVTSDTRNPLPEGMTRVPDVNDMEGLAFDWSFSAFAELVPDLGEISISGSVITITTPSPLGGTLGVPFSVTMKATGGTPPYAWTLDESSPPIEPFGLTLSSAGVLSGTPPPPFPQWGFITVRVTDSEGNTATKNIFISTGVRVTGWTGAGYVNTAYLNVPTFATLTLHAIGGTAPYTWARIPPPYPRAGGWSGGGNIPPGLHLNSSTGIISGTPTVSGVWEFFLVATDSASHTSLPFYCKITVA